MSSLAGVFSAADAKIIKDDDVKKIMGAELGQPSVTSAGLGLAVPDSRSRSAQWCDRSLRLQVSSVSRRANETRLMLLATNLGQESAPLYFFGSRDGKTVWSWRTYLVDDLGNRYHAVSEMDAFSVDLTPHSCLIRLANVST